jgi:hypothetical protein
MELLYPFPPPSYFVTIYLKQPEHLNAHLRNKHPQNTGGGTQARIETKCF